ncbi:low specificity L-threonine aldolase [Halorubellus sp. JP-L1]|uniref:threonine aldolase family protein n=1 Tax=Halorubellus sp. JP-L1 TaxID=2715753 RepID=UPI00140923F4|nr:low specificity L-threonine aldolase [Halorubellus sp. JP-L1]NHN41739.1 low specificity L-threonine aldolase [Halorubellus sp. JP-L1]
MIDLRSDTVTKPSEEMRAAMADADVGDDVYEEDPTLAELESRAAEMLGMDAALFVPSGTMGNQIAARVHTERGQEAVVDVQSHVYKWELAGFAQHSELQVRTFDAERGVPTPEQVADALVDEDLHRAGTGLLCLENTHNSRGGLAIAPEELGAAADVAHDHGVPVHLDGARLFNAAVALDEPASAFADVVDSVMFCLSKGLGAPVGSMLVGDEEFVADARRVRKLLGGGMRQAGVLGAAGLHALENVERLATDHERARLLAAGLDDVDGIAVQEPETNIVVADVTGTGMTEDAFASACEDAGVRCSGFGGGRVRLCTHLDVSRNDVDEAIARIGDVVA